MALLDRLRGDEAARLMAKMVCCSIMGAGVGFWFARRGVRTLGVTAGPVLRHALSHPEEELKMVFCVRSDLKMTKGKVAAQVGHAAVACFEETLQAEPKLLDLWRENDGCTKICLRIKSLEDLESVQAAARAQGLTACAIEDYGRTQVAAGSVTVLGVGPGPWSIVDACTGHLQLF